MWSHVGFLFQALKGRHPAPVPCRRCAALVPDLFLGFRGLTPTARGIPPRGFTRSSHWSDLQSGPASPMLQERKQIRRQFAQAIDSSRLKSGTASKGTGGARKQPGCAGDFSPDGASRPLINLCMPTATGRYGMAIFIWTIGVRNPAPCGSIRIAANKSPNRTISARRGVGGSGLSTTRSLLRQLAQLLTSLSFSLCCHASIAAPPSGDEILSGAAARIESHRKADAVVRVVDAGGQPVPDVEVQVEQTRHAFLFGSNIFQWGRLPSETLENAYRDRFAALLNYATLGFYWPAYQRRPGEPRHEFTEQVALVRGTRDRDQRSSARVELRRPVLVAGRS